MKQNTLVKILFFVTFLTVLTGILLSALKSSLPVFFMILASVIYTASIIIIVALDNKYLLSKMSSLWVANLQASVPEYDSNLAEFSDHLHNLNLETQKSVDESRILALEVENIRHNLTSKFVGALTTRRVHEKHCRFARNIKEQNKIAFKFERDARKQGFAPCKCLS